MPSVPAFQRAELSYPFETRPGDGELMEVAPGLHWLRMPLPFSLNHINLWVLEDGEGFSLVDTGLASDTTIDLWQNLFGGVLKGRGLERILVTHMHPDHLGLAGWLNERSGAPLLISRTEYLSCRSLLQYSHEQAPQDAIAFYRGAGFDTEQLNYYRSQFGGFGRLMHGLPHSFTRLEEGDLIEIGARQWRVMMGEGHSPEHACFYCEADNLFISGDQLLPTISSNVSVWPSEPHANPLELWLNSCQRLASELNEDTLVLPSHGKPFTGAPGRLHELIDEHEGDLRALVEYCRTPRRAVDCFERLFRVSITRSNLIMATGESLAHLNCLLARGLLRCETDPEGVNWYSSR
ncbi:MBL fold metallo-hydrolase [Aestuariirhabdus litorea]|uniref:MBL fold metallo-hydrolase n=1 Tax=Aestuariirhabdus litorea TaxID=2528527 RepID=A0A3P3VRV6_9GAMM|nr:MBL fold metallo-hydrolase [Aestuariirhabdus litorea]RRJ85047.1 MBL fold metallo-hydrolase [Aestuariirhabdus litorea]RWW98272.1 MBL fold metallo-hydrolase [Endozoicomonadaceae bacterium GTF-13]